MNIDKCFISILGAELTKNKVSICKEDLTDDKLKLLNALSIRQGLSNIVNEYLLRENLISNKAIAENFRSSLLTSVTRSEQMRFDLSLIENIFNKNKISYVLLKGSVVRNFFPKEYMRTSSDIDILVREDDIDTAVSALCKENFTFLERTYHDVSIATPSKSHLELHFNLLETKDNIDGILANAWDYTILEKNYKYKFTDEFFLFYFIAHMMYHFTTTGCGIKFLCDLWVIENKMGIKLDTSKKLLEKAEIYKFAKEMFELSHICFNGKQGSQMSYATLSFMLSGGALGNSENLPMMSAATKNRSGILYALGRLFPPYKIMRETYPVLKKVPIVLPVVWLYRISYKLKAGKIKSATKEFKTANAIKENDIEYIKRILDFLEIQ